MKRRDILSAVALAPFAPYLSKAVWADPDNVVTPSMFSDTAEMFAVSNAVIRLPAGSSEFSSPIQSKQAVRIEAHPDAVLVPTFRLEGKERATPLITLAAGAKANSLRVSLKPGINDVRIVVQISDMSMIGRIRCSSDDLNNNRTASGPTDLVSGAVVISGNSVIVDEISLSRFDAGWAVINSADVTIQRLINIETVRGGYVHGTSRLNILSGYTSGPSDPSEPNSFVSGRGIMTPGANSLLLAGCSDSSFSNWQTFDTLEHAIRVGRVATGTTVPNHRLTFNKTRIYRPYGCGLKCDDADDFNIKHVTINDLYTEDVGRENWFGSPGYENWSAPSGRKPPGNNDGNKVACAIRNSEFVTLTGFRNRAVKAERSGFFGLWLERSRNVQAYNVDTHRSVMDGVVVQSGGRISPDNVEIRQVTTANNGGSGLKLDATASSSSWRSLSILDLFSDENEGAGVEVTNTRANAYAFEKPISRITGSAYRNVGSSIRLPDSKLRRGNLRLSINDNNITY